MGIVAEHKYYDTHKRFDLFERVIENISPTYEIEIRTIRELCNDENGLASVNSLKEQNILLRKMISIAPGERVPRHRLIRNLIELNHFDAADTDVKVFGSDFKKMDAPTSRYRINLATARAIRGPGLMHEDRVVLLRKAEEIAVAAARRHKTAKSVLGAYCEVGLEITKLTGDFAAFDSAMSRLKEAEEQVGDPDISSMIARLQRRFDNIMIEPAEVEEAESSDY